MEIENGSNYTSTPKKQIITEKLICPNCTETVNIISKKDLLISNGINQLPKNFNTSEFSKITCEKCNFDFSYIICPFCSEKIFMKIYPLLNKYNGMNGFNIKCPYKLCNHIFYFSECPNCGESKKINKFIKEGDIIICPNDSCKFQYIQTNCPYELCQEKSWTPRPKDFSNFPSGLILFHKKIILYQKISCYNCRRPICFASKKLKQNKYYEGQRVLCPYPDCNKIFNRLICPKCSNDNYIDEGWYEYGTEIKCSLCKENFGKILCPTCGEMSICKEKYFKYGEMICGNDKCRQVHNLMKCLFCRQINILPNKINLIGRRIKCGYCSQSFCKITCPYCNQINPFPFGNFFFGKLYKCQYFNCLKEFQFLICPKCNIYSTITNKKEGQKYQCYKCNTVYMNFGCKFCKFNILAQDTTIKIGQLIQCPNPSCNKIFSFMQCHKCEKLIYSEEKENIYGKAKKCLNPNCKEYTIMTLCPLCNKRVIYCSRNNIEENELVKCKNCEKRYPFHRIDNLYKGNLKILEELEGKAFDFGIAEVDKNYLVKENLFFSKNDLSLKNSLLENNPPINTGECIACHHRKKESVFFPCGHRCTCYICANLFFASDKKCPKCKKEATCIIRKVYE